jgi:hypothetical protein
MLQWILVDGIDYDVSTAGLEIGFRFFQGTNPEPIAAGRDVIPAIRLRGWVNFSEGSRSTPTNRPTGVVNLARWGGPPGNTAQPATLSNILATFVDIMTVAPRPNVALPTTGQVFGIKREANQYRVLGNAASLTDLRSTREGVIIELGFQDVLVGQTPRLGGGGGLVSDLGNRWASITDTTVFPYTVIEVDPVSTTGSWDNAFLLYVGTATDNTEWIYEAFSRGYIGRPDGRNGNWVEFLAITPGVASSGDARLTFFAAEAGSYTFRLTLREVVPNAAGVLMYQRGQGLLLADQEFTIVAQQNVVSSMTNIPWATPTGTQLRTAWQAAAVNSITDYLNNANTDVGSGFAANRPVLPRGVILRNYQVFTASTGAEFLGTVFATATEYIVRVTFGTDPNTVFETRTPVTTASAESPLWNPGVAFNATTNPVRTFNQGLRSTATDISFVGPGAPSRTNNTDVGLAAQEQITSFSANEVVVTFGFTSSD